VCRQIAEALFAARIFFLEITAGPGCQVRIRTLQEADALQAAILLLEAGWHARVKGTEVIAVVAAA